MPVPDSATFKRMLAEAQKGGYALASINVTSTTTANAALAAFAETNSDGIIQISTGGGEFLSGPVKDMALGAASLADHVRMVSERLNVYTALTTDHCTPDKVEKFVRPLMAITRERRKAGLPNLFNGHMFDGSELPMKENLAIAAELLKEAHELDLVLEVEIGIVGGEEDGLDNTHAEQHKLYTSPEDMLLAYDTLHPHGDFTLAAAFGNVHGVYKPGNVKLRPEVLKEGNELVMSKYGKGAEMNLVFHGGSGSLLSEIHDAVSYGVVKMNVDTDCQYAYTRPIVDHMLKHYDGVLRIDGEMGDKKTYDPRSYMKAAEAGMKARVKEASTDLLSLGKSVYGKI